MPIKNMSPEEVAAATASVIASAGKSTDKANRLPGETASEANARITAAYKEMLAKPVLSAAAKDAGAEVRFVRTGAGGQGEYTVVTPVGYSGPAITTTNWTPGIIPATGKYTSGTTLGVYSNGDGTYSKVGDVTPTTFLNPAGTGSVGSKTSGSSGSTGSTVGAGAGKGPATQTINNGDGSVTYVYADGTKSGPVWPNGSGTGNLTTGSTVADTTVADANKTARQSAYDLLLNQFQQYGLGSLVEGIKNLIQENVSPSEFAIRLQNTDAYKQRFAANQDRIKQGLRALTPAEYIGLEDQYQNIMRNYGLPASYWSKDSMGTQAGFNKFIANDVSAAELEDRIATAQKRVLNSDVNTLNALKQFYPDINTSDLLAYTLDPTNALENIKRKVTAAEIGGAALGQGLMTSAASAEDLAKYGITKAQAQQGYGTIAEFLPTAEKLGDIYSKQGLGDYTQGTAEQEIFGTAGAADAARKRKKLTQLEQAQFGGSSGQAQGALARDRAGSI